MKFLFENWNIKKGLKIKKLFINNYKVLKNFEIDFCDKNNNPLPIIVLAGINGSGKTAVLESIYGIKKIGGIRLETILDNEKKVFNSNTSALAIGGEGIKQFWYNDEIKGKIHYFSYQSSLRDIKNFLPEYIQKLVFEYDIKASEVYKKIRENINDIFDSLNINIEFDSRDGKGNLFFKHKITGEKFLIDELSSGERTLISEVLYLYLSNIKNMVILIDEPELSLHPKWQSKILKLYEDYAIKNNCQIILATHSPLIIGSAKSEYLRVLNFEKNKVVVKKFNRSYGLEFNKILLEIMGINNLRTEEVEKDFNKLREYILMKNWEKYKQLYNKMYSYLGEDVDLKLLNMQARLKGFND
ncbi:AAA family ATPase [Caminibacter pacificus]|uniref:AbiEii toxin of type IV toxin-antitoxin system n=1 Tax=Caminibacter pacificus TaxID=1424653 RepID=A0AAJ4RDS2_9BACT|nr:AAA family ATPase [Caminibacter pacificus]QCI28549.1 hypothetical protein C6V80_06110 [Caminibacter pacificus]ROR40724.1 putative AbiEii toxin of type IV toxin-antitoxin system [Caminibacter pacificus]